MSANERIQWFHKMIVTGCYPNAHDISVKFNISQRQAQRDLVHMRTSLEAPLTYDAARRGYFYAEPFVLPAMLNTEEHTDYNSVISGIREFTESAAEISVIQMQLPYSAVLEIKDKITVMNLHSFIVSEERHHRYRCEFPSIELFLGVIISTGAEIRIISPDWLREKLVDFAKRILEANDINQ